MHKMAKILQLKIKVDGIRPLIWRRFLVRDNITFEKLHVIIQELMGWDNYHLYEFNINRNIISPNDEDDFNPAEGILNQLKRSPDFQKMLENSDLSKGPVSLDVNKVNKILEDMNEEKIDKNKFDIKTKINQLLNIEKINFRYRYDFGDNWECNLIVEKILEEEPNKKYSVCIAGERAGPPEDCSGIWGYEELIKIQKDKNHPDYEERIKDWLGEGFDFEEFNIEDINKRL